MSKIITAIIIAILCISNVFGQELLVPTDAFSSKKVCYITKNDGSELKGYVKYFKYKKGLVDDLKFEDMNGKKSKVPASEIKSMYLMPSNVGKFFKFMDAVNNVETYMDGSINEDFLKDGYVYFESTQVKIKKKEFTALLQLLNPTYSSKVRVFYDPFGGETASAGIGGITVVGGDAKTYIISKKDEIGYKLKKKNYEAEYVPLWKDCTAMQGNTDIKWSDFSKHVVEYSGCSND